jgi:hypothetical protein
LPKEASGADIFSGPPSRRPSSFGSPARSVSPVIPLGQSGMAPLDVFPGRTTRLVFPNDDDGARRDHALALGSPQPRFRCLIASSHSALTRSLLAPTAPVSRMISAGMYGSETIDPPKRG